MTSLHAVDQAPLPTSGVLAVFAHPDDETLGAGAFLALASRAGLGTAVVTATRGELGEVIPAELSGLRDDHEALAHERTHELAKALRALGVPAHRFLDAVPGLSARRPAHLTDSGMVWARPGLAAPAPDTGETAFANVDVDVAARLLAAIIRDARPQLVITEEAQGSYGHPDHVQVHRVTMRAVELAADAPEVPDDDDPLAGRAPWRVPVVGWVVEPEPAFRAALQWLESSLRHTPQFGTRGDVLATIPADSRLPSMVVPADEVDLTVDTVPVLRSVTAAMHAHRTQVQGVHLLDLTRAEDRNQPVCGWFAVHNGLILPILPTASLKLAPGWDRVDELTATRDDEGLAKDRLGPVRGADRLAAFLGAERVELVAGRVE